MHGWLLHSIYSSPSDLPPAQPARVDLSPTLQATCVRATCPYVFRNTPVFRLPWPTVAVWPFGFPLLPFQLEPLLTDTARMLISQHKAITMSPNAAHLETMRLAAETPVVPTFSVFSEPSLLAASQVHSSSVVHSFPHH